MNDLEGLDNIVPANNCDNDIDKIINEELGLTISLPDDVDIFKRLDRIIIEDVRIREFVRCFKETISNSINMLTNFSFPQLLYSATENGIQITWAFNYFRTYFCFNNGADDNYGIIAKRPNEIYFTNILRRLEIDKYREITQFVLENVLFLVEGNKEY